MKELTVSNILNDTKSVVRDFPQLKSDELILMFDDLKIEIINDNNKYEVRILSKRFNVVSIAVAISMLIALIKYYPEFDTKLMILRLNYIEPFRSWVEFNALFDRTYNPESAFFRYIAIQNADEDLIKYIATNANDAYIQETIKQCDACNCMESKAILLRYIKHDKEDIML